MNSPVRKNVLYVEAQSNFRSQIEEWTAGLSHFELIPAPDLSTLTENPPQDLDPCLILLDGRQEPQHTLEWAQTLKMAFPAPMIIFYDGNSTLSFTDLKKNGADILMHFYYDTEFVVDKILEFAPWSGEAPPPLSVLNPISLEDLSSEMDLNFDLYVHLPSNQKSVLIRKKGSPVEDHVISKARELHQNLYFKKNELKQFLEYSRTALSLKNSELSMSVTDKTLRARIRIQEIISSFFDLEGTDFKAGKVIYENCEKIMQVLDINNWKTKTEVIDSMTVFSGRPRTYYNDVITMCVLSSGFAYLLNKPQDVIHDLALAGLLHNVGLAFLSKPHLDVDLVSLSSEDLREYISYPERSVNQVKHKKVPLQPRVSELILQHREDSVGTGFPKKTTSDFHDPNSRIIQLAFAVMELTQLQNNKARYTFEGALQLLQDQTMSGTAKIDGATLLTLRKALK